MKKVGEGTEPSLFPKEDTPVKEKKKPGRKPKNLNV